jgi:hypothetical protein
MDHQYLKKIYDCPFKSCATSALRPLEVKSGPHLARADVKLSQRRATEAVTSSIFAHFSSDWPLQYIRPFLACHNRRCLKKRSKRACLAVYRLANHIYYCGGL